MVPVGHSAFPSYIVNRLCLVLCARGPLTCALCSHFSLYAQSCKQLFSQVNYPLRDLIGAVAYGFCKPKVGSSILSTGTISRHLRDITACLAQLFCQYAPNAVSFVSNLHELCQSRFGSTYSPSFGGFGRTPPVRQTKRRPMLGALFPVNRFLDIQ